MSIVVATLNAKYIHTSLAIRCLKAHCAPEFLVDIVEYTIHDPPMHIVMDLYARQPTVLGFSCYIWNIEQTITVIAHMRQLCPALLIVLGGPEVSYDTAYWMNRLAAVDVIVQGEGEETFKHLLQVATGDAPRKQAQKTLHLVWGCAYRKADGGVVLNPPRPKVPMDTLASPHRFAEDVPHLPNRIVYVETSRGCPFSCQFCLSSIEVGVRYHSLERAKEDLRYLIEHGATLIKFVDRTFNIRRDYALALFAFLIAHHGGRCVFQFEITADILRPEVIAYLAEHAPPGLFRFEIGVQSTNDATNALVERKQNFQKLAHTVTAIRNSGRIVQHLDLIAGLPQEDYASFQRTFDDVFALRPEELQLGFLKMLRGTGVRRDAAKFGYVYSETAPYEILGNDILSFAEMTRMKRAEDMVEKYWNTHRFDETLHYLFAHVFSSPYAFFESLGLFWHAQGWGTMGHQLETLYARLFSFMVHLGHTVKDDLDVIRGLLHWDYVCQHRHRPRKGWEDTPPDAPIWKSVMQHVLRHPEHVVVLPRRRATSAQMCPSFLALVAQIRDVHKQLFVQMIPFDIEKYATEGTIDRKTPTLLLAYYRAKEGVSLYVGRMPPSLPRVPLDQGVVDGV